MAKTVHLRREASSLLKAVKTAFKFIRDNPVGPESEREALLQQLREVIDRADPPIYDADLASIRLAMTNPTADKIIEIFEKRDEELDRAVLEAVQKGIRRTKQRAYIRLELDMTVLRRLRFVLLTSRTDYQDKPFKRLAQFIEEEALAKNPMEIIARMGL